MRTQGTWLAIEHVVGDHTRWFISINDCLTIAALNSPCLVYSNAENDALHIVKCVNTHDDLLAALKRTRDALLAIHSHYYPNCDHGCPDHEALQIAEQAIKKAQP